MKRIGVIIFGTVWFFWIAGNNTQAQQYPANRPAYGPTRPQLSPYLNFFRGGNPATNYYLGVVPEFDRRQNQRQFGTALQDLERRPRTPSGENEDILPTIQETGHPTYFLNYSSYYNLPNYPFPGSTPAQPPQSRSRRGR